MAGKLGLEVMADAAKLCAAGHGFESNKPIAQANSALSAIKSEAVVFVFCGNGAGRTDLQTRCEGLPNVRFLDLQPMDRLNDLLALADMHLLPQRADAADLVMPSKLTGMLANVVQGLAQAAGSEPQALIDLANNPAQRTRMGAAGCRYAEQHLHTDAVLGRFVARVGALAAVCPNQ